ncbi:hypothetical protein BC332_02680 [Capsicum chinense]|nr:hypothetical protein BC332_02680 [Capsicum chinense]
MGVEDAPLDDKSKRMRDLLSSFYSPDPTSPSKSPNTSSRFATLDTINTTAFDADQYMNLLVQKSNLEGLLQRHVDLAAEIKNLDTDLQMLVYENYNKFQTLGVQLKLNSNSVWLACYDIFGRVIDPDPPQTPRCGNTLGLLLLLLLILTNSEELRMKNNIVGMETNMEQLLEKIISVQSRSDGVNTSLFDKREHIEKLHRTRNLLRKVQASLRAFRLIPRDTCHLPPTTDNRLAKCIKSEAYADAVKYYIGAMPIFKIYGNSSFLDCKRASEEAIAIIIKALQGKVFSDSESIQARAEAIMLLKQLDFPVNNLKVQLFEKLEQFLVDLHLEYKSASSSAHEASIREFAEAVRAYRVIFPDSEQQLFRLAKDLATKHFEAAKQHIKKQLSSADLVAMLRPSISPFSRDSES